MKNLRIILIAVLLTIMSNISQSQTTVVWQKQFGTDKEEYARNHIVDKSGNIYVSGNTTGVMSDKNLGKNDGFLTKIDNSGNTIWSKQFGSDENEDVQWSAMDGKGNIYIVGTTLGNLENKNFGKEDIFLTKFSSDGKQIWTKQFGCDSTDIATGIFVNNKGYIYLAGSTMGKMGKSNHGNQDAFVMKLNNDGIPVYRNQFGTPEHDGCNAITGDNSGNLYIAGITFGKLGNENKGFMDFFVGKFKDKDSTIKFNQYGSEGFDIATTILIYNQFLDL